MIGREMRSELLINSPAEFGWDGDENNVWRCHSFFHVIEKGNWRRKDKSGQKSSVSFISQCFFINIFLSYPELGFDVQVAKMKGKSTSPAAAANNTCFHFIFSPNFLSFPWTSLSMLSLCINMIKKKSAKLK